MMKTILPVLVMLICFIAAAQNKKIDSLLIVNDNYKKEDSLKAVYLTNIFRQYARLNNYDKVEEYGAKAIAVAQKLSQTNSIIYIYKRLALCYHGASKYLPALSYYTKGLEIAKNNNKQANIAEFYLDMGALYGSIPDYPKALEANNSAVTIYNALGDQEDLSSCYMNIGEIYNDIHQPEKAIEYMQKALAIFKTNNGGIDYGVCVAYQGLANTYMSATEAELSKIGINPAKRNQLAMDLLNKALAVAESLKDSSLIGSVNSDIGTVYETMGKTDIALKYHEKALTITQKGNDQESIGNAFFKLGNYYVNTNNYPKSFIYLNQSLHISQQTGLLALQQNTLEMLSKAYEKIGRFDTAITFYKKYIIIRDSIYGKEKEKEVTRQKLQLDFTIKENDYKLTQQITDGKLKQQLLIATQQQQQLLLKQQQLQLVNKEKDFQKLTYLKKQDELKTQQLLQASLLQKNTLQAKYDKEISNKQIAKKDVQIKYDEKVKIFLGTAIAVAIAVAFFVYYNQRKTSKLNTIISSQKAELEQLGHVKDKIFSVVSHDMRAPVNSLISFTSILEDGQIPQEKLAIYAKNLKQNLSYTSALMDNLLNWAASQMQGFKPVKEQFDMAVLATDVINTLQHHTQQKEVQVFNNISANSLIKADRNMLSAIMRNIISNAIKFSYPKGIITIALEAINNGWNITINDEGTGMQPEQIQQFNSKNLQSAESKRGTANEKGTGLGLLLCKTFIGLMDGSIAAKNTDKGTAFIIWLPDTVI